MIVGFSSRYTGLSLYRPFKEAITQCLDNGHSDTISLYREKHLDCEGNVERLAQRLAVEHWNAECVGWHVCKVGSRFAALDPIAQGLDRRYGSLDADVARGLALRMDHGSQYLSDHFLKQIRYWGIHPSFGFVEEPETNGVAERWNRTLKEQAIHGRIFQNLEAVRAAVADFVERYNQTWRLEKLGYQTPIEAREEYELRQAA